MSQNMESADSREERLDLQSFRSGFWTLVYQAANHLFLLIWGIIMARLLSPKDYGLIAMLAIFWALYNIFADGGFGLALIQKKKINREDLSTVFYFNFLLSVICLAIALLTAPFIANFYHEPVLKKIIWIYSWSLLLTPIASIQSTLLCRNMRQDINMLCCFLAFLLSAPPAIYLAYSGWGVWALVWQGIIANISRAFFLFLFVRWLPSFCFQFSSLWSFFRFGIKIFGTNLISTFSENLHYIIIGKFFTPTDLGYFERAKNYTSIWPTSIYYAIQGVLFPAFSKLQDDFERLRDAFRRSLAITFFIVSFPMLLLGTLSVPFIELIISAKWLPIVPYWWLFTIHFLIYPVFMLNRQLLIAIGRSDLLLWSELFRTFFMILSILVFFHYGIAAMLFGLVCSSVATFLFDSRLVRKKTGFTQWEQIRICLPYLLLSVLSCLVSWILYKEIYSWGLFCRFCIPALVGPLCYLMLNRLFRTAAYLDCLTLAKEISPKYSGFFTLLEGKKK